MEQALEQAEMRGNPTRDRKSEESRCVMGGLSEVRESEVESYLGRIVEKAGGRCVKFTGVRGWPDRIVVLPARPVTWVELKRPKGGRLSAAQLVAHEQLRRLGQRVDVVWTMEQADQVVGELLAR